MLLTQLSSLEERYTTACDSIDSLEKRFAEFTNATDAADYLVKKGVPFRDAHGIIGKLVLYCIDKNCSIEDLSLEELKSISDVFEADIYDAITLKTCVEKRLTKGAPGPKQMEEVLKIHEKYLKDRNVLFQSYLKEE